MRIYQNNRTPTMEQELVFSAILVGELYKDRMRNLLEHDMNWSTIRQFAIFHHVVPLLYDRLRNLAGENVPSETLDELMKLYRAIAVQNLRKAEHLLHVMSLLSRHGIVTLALKGPSLAVQLYGDLSLRQFNDLDILIHEKDFYRTCELLTMEGYRQAIEVNPDKKKRLIKTGNDLHFIRQGYSVELHWGVANKMFVSPLECEEFWQRLEKIHILDTAICALPPETLFLFLCHHGANHQWDRLKWIADIAQLIKIYPDLDLFALRNKAQNIGFLRAFDLGILLAERFGGIKLPENLYKEINDNPVVEKLFNQVKNKSIIEASVPGGISGAFFFLRSREKVSDWLLYIRNLVFLPRQIDWIVFDIPDYLYPLYYLIRPIRLFYLISLRFFDSIIGKFRHLIK
jgi:hypothetical protein